MSEAEADPITEEQVAAAQADEPATFVAPELHDDPEPEPEPEYEPEPEPEPQAPPQDVVMEARYRKIETAAKQYASRVSNIMEEQALDLIACPLCSLGGTPAFLNKHDAGRIPEPIANGVKQFLGFSTLGNYEPDPDVTQCIVCKGKGETSTGSLVPNNETRICAKCKGFGYVPPPSFALNGDQGGELVHLPVGERTETVDPNDVDISGEPRFLPDGRKNPNFGLWPQYKVQVPPWGETVGLTAQDATG